MKDSDILHISKDRAERAEAEPGTGEGLCQISGYASVNSFMNDASVGLIVRAFLMKTR